MPQTPTQPSRRRQIMEVAAGLFAERGFHGVSIYDLGSALGTSGPALYKHFPSKDALLGAILVDVSEGLLAEGNRRVDAAGGQGPDAVLSALVAWHVEFALTHPALITVQLRDLASAPERDRRTVRRLQRAYVELWVSAIGAATGSDEAHARSAAHAVFGLLNSTPHSARVDGEEMARLLQTMAIAAIRASGVSAARSPGERSR